ncbi:MAG: SAM-dependent chlorinase/fluorinase [Deltaproteobacteria bacterium]|nr:SAM-dependent chlorinase/fluorinase [Deltaproteobacteria bacterium]
MAARNGIVTLTTDFGTADGFAGALRGAVLSAASGVRVVDITHEVPARSVREGAFALRAAAPFFPPGTVHLGVVDPGVGSDRRLLVIVDHGMQQVYVGPDNGLFSYVLDEARAFETHEIDPAGFRATSTTFHGRDILGPVAGRIAGGADPLSFGPPVVEPLRLPRHVEPMGAREGRVLQVDRFGNLVTTLRPLGGDVVVDVGGARVARRVTCYAELAPDEPGWYVGSLGLIEVALGDGSAAEAIQRGVDAPVRLL